MFSLDFKATRGPALRERQPGPDVPDVGGLAVVAPPADERRSGDGERVQPDDDEQEGRPGAGQGASRAGARAGAEARRPPRRARHDEGAAPQGERGERRDGADACVGPSLARRY